MLPRAGACGLEAALAASRAALKIPSWLPFLEGGRFDGQNRRMGEAGKPALSSG
jgi:hypothetical protein